MKYTNLTKEQRESITPYLESLLRELIKSKKCDSDWEWRCEIKIKTYQQAQKEEIEFWDKEYTFKEFAKDRINKLKFESELE